MWIFPNLTYILNAVSSKPSKLFCEYYQIIYGRGKTLQEPIRYCQEQSLQTLRDFKVYYRTIRRHGSIGGKITRSLDQNKEPRNECT